VPGGARAETPETRRRRFKRNAFSAVASLRTTPGLTENIAPIPAILGIGLEKRNRMTHEQFEREMRYRTVMAVARSMLNRGLISKEEYEDFDRKMIKKHDPFFGGLRCQSTVDKS
jgi:hypothetical protein